MNLRCFYCQTPFTLGRAEVLGAIQRMHAENLHHYDAHCPRCRRANSVARERLELAFPNWRQVAEEQAANPPAPTPVPVPAPVVEKPAVTAVAEPVKAAPKAAKKPAAKKTTEKKPAAKPATKKTATKTAAKPKAKPAVSKKK